MASIDNRFDDRALPAEEYYTGTMPEHADISSEVAEDKGRKLAEMLTDQYDQDIPYAADVARVIPGDNRLLLGSEKEGFKIFGSAKADAKVVVMGKVVDIIYTNSDRMLRKGMFAKLTGREDAGKSSDDKNHGYPGVTQFSSSKASDAKWSITIEPVGGCEGFGKMVEQASRDYNLDTWGKKHTKKDSDEEYEISDRITIKGYLVDNQYNSNWSFKKDNDSVLRDPSKPDACTAFAGRIKNFNTMATSLEPGLRFNPKDIVGEYLEEKNGDYAGPFNAKSQLAVYTGGAPFINGLTGEPIHPFTVEKTLRKGAHVALCLAIKQFTKAAVANDKYKNVPFNIKDDILILANGDPANEWGGDAGPPDYTTKTEKRVMALGDLDAPSPKRAKTE